MASDKCSPGDGRDLKDAVPAEQDDAVTDSEVVHDDLVATEDLSWRWGHDNREWVEPNIHVDWPRGWVEPVALIHYPPRVGRWFWIRAVGRPLQCPVGSIAIVPRPLSDGEVDELVAEHRRLHNSYLAFAHDSYLYLVVCVVCEDGELIVRHKRIIPAYQGEWEVYLPRQVAEEIDGVVDDILDDPGWQVMARTPRRDGTPRGSSRWTVADTEDSGWCFVLPDPESER